MTAHRFYAGNQRDGGDRHLYAARTRFIPDSILGKFERVAWPRAVGGAVGASGKGSGAKVDIGARLRGMWG